MNLIFLYCLNKPRHIPTSDFFSRSLAYSLNHHSDDSCKLFAFSAEPRIGSDVLLDSLEFVDYHLKLFVLFIEHGQVNR
jgi:hypothetical protein